MPETGSRRALGGMGKLSGGQIGVCDLERRERREGRRESRRKNAWREGEWRKVG